MNAITTGNETRYLHGVEHVTKDCKGYVYWKDTQVEHYSFEWGDDAAAEEAAATKELANQCRHLEHLGVPVNCNSAVWHWSWFEHATPETESLVFLAQMPCMYAHEDGRRIGWLIEAEKPAPKEYPYSRQRKMRVWDRETRGLETLSFMSDDLDGHYHPLKAMGWHIPQAGQAKDQGLVYATTEGMMELL